MDEAAYSYQEEGAALEASLGLDCDGDSAEAEQTEEGGHSAARLEKHDSQELPADLEAVGRAARSVCAGDEETPGPFRTKVAEK